MADLAEQSGRSARYTSDIRGIVSALWRDALDGLEAEILLYDTVRIGLTRAGHEGAAMCGITPKEMSLEERATIDQAIANEHHYVRALVDDVIAGNRASGGKLSAFSARIALWGNRYESVRMTISAMACGDKKMMWKLGPTKDHCRSCLAVAGKVKRNSTWLATVLPGNFPNDKLICKGAGKCELVPADDMHLSPGPLPRLP